MRRLSAFFSACFCNVWYAFEAAAAPYSELGSPGSDVVASVVTQGDLVSLDDLILQAVVGHSFIDARRSELKAAQAMQESAEMQFWPSPSVRGSSDKSGAGTFTARLSQPLWTGGRLTAGLDEAKARVRASDVGVTEQQQTVAFSVIDAYQGFMQGRLRQESLVGFLKRLQRYEEGIGRRVSTGVSPTVDLTLLKARKATTLSQLSASKAAEHAALAQLSQWFGRPLTREEVAVTEAHSWELPDLEMQLSKSLAYSPTIHRIKQEIEAGRNMVKVRRSDMLPTISLVAEHGRDSLFGGDSSSNRLLLELEYVPGAGLSARSGMRAAQAQVDSQEFNLSAARSQLEARVRSDYEEARSVQDRKREAQVNVDAAAEVLASYERLFIAGKRSWLDLMNSARELSDAQIISADLHAQDIAARYRLDVNAGELNQPGFRGGSIF